MGIFSGRPGSDRGLQRNGGQASHVLSAAQLDQLLTTPKCLEGHRTNQTGPLSRLDKKPGEPDDSTFTVEKVSVPSDGLLIRGWLYLPRNAGTQKFPLIVLNWLSAHLIRR